MKCILEMVFPPPKCMYDVFVAVAVLFFLHIIYIIKSMLGQEVKRRVKHQFYNFFSKYKNNNNANDDEKRIRFHIISHAMQTYHVWYLQINGPIERTNERANGTSTKLTDTLRLRPSEKWMEELALSLPFSLFVCKCFLEEKEMWTNALKVSTC